MKNIFFYLATVLIWGSTWIGIKFQLGTVDPMVSVGYRFGLAALLILIWCKIKNLKLTFDPKAHFFIAIQGVFLFCLNYLFFYLAELELTSGLAAVIFSTILFMNVVNGRIFLGTALDPRILWGGVLGLIGIILVFKAEVTSFSLASDNFKAVLLCFLATYFASLGNIISARNQKHQLPIVQTNGFGMGYGAIIMLAMAFFTGKNFAVEPSFLYLGSLLYLAVFGSIVAFGCYLTLVGNIGPERAAYATLLFPLVALAISTVCENYSWTINALSGVLLILLGNLFMLNRKTNPSKNKEQKTVPSTA